MQALVIIVNILLILVALLIIVCVLMQQGSRSGLGAIAGGAETFFGKSKAKGIDAKLHLITKIAAVVFIVLAIVCTILTAQINKNEAVSEEVAVESTEVTEEAAEEEAPAEEAAAEEAPAEEPAAEEAPAEEPAAEEAPAEEAAPEEAPAEEETPAA